MVLHGANAVGSVVVNARGPARANDLAYARRRVDAVHRIASAPVRVAKVDLVIQSDPPHELSVFARAELHFERTVVRAQASASSVTEAVDVLEARLTEEVRRAVDR